MTQLYAYIHFKVIFDDWNHIPLLDSQFALYIFKRPTSHNLLDMILNQSIHMCWIPSLCRHWLVSETSLTANSHPLILWMCSDTHLCPALCNPMNYNPPGSCVHGILPARILKWSAISPSRGFSRHREWNCLLSLVPWQADSLPLSLLGNPSFG